MRRAVKLRSTLVKRRTATLARLDAQLEILSPAWVGALRSDMIKTAPLFLSHYHRLMVSSGKHHTSALCHIATSLLTRIAACWRRGAHYIIRDTDGRPVTTAEARAIIADRYTVSAELRAAQRALHARGTDRRSKESPRAPSTGSSTRKATTPGAA